MLIEYILGAAVTLGLLDLPRLRAGASRTFLEQRLGAISMTLNGWLQIALFCAVIILLVKPFGGYMARVFAGERTFLSPVLGPVERALLPRCAASTSAADQNWVAYAVAMLLFSLVGFARLYALMRLQAFLPFNPAGLARSRRSRLQHGDELHHQHQLAVLRPETTMSYFTQMAGSPCTTSSPPRPASRWRSR